MICRQCKQDKLPGEFIWKTNAQVAHGQKCKSCFRQNNNNPEYKLRQRLNHIKRLYGISHEEYLVLLENQKGLCAICGKESSTTGKNSTLHVDHCHKRNVVRGLLCYGCNIAIGFLGEDLDRIYKVIDYLGLHSLKEDLK